MRTSRWTTIVVAAGALAISSSAPALGRGAAVVGCGAVLTADTTLTADLLDCAGDGLVVGADSITLNLNGQVVDRDAVEDPTDMGIRVTGHHDVRVTNGTVQGFYRGVVFESSPSGVVTSMTVPHSTRRGIVFVDGSDGAQVLGNVSADNHASGIAIVASDGASVVGNRSLRNIGGAGVRLEGATHATVAHNALDGDSFGIQIEGGVENRVLDNAMAGKEEAAVTIEFSDRNVVHRNLMTHSGGGVGVGGGNDNVITDNRILHSVGRTALASRSSGSATWSSGTR